eukprot:12240226-Alexandrium_andersonii.AAC.1
MPAGPIPPKVENECDFYRYGERRKGDACNYVHIEANLGCERHLGHPIPRWREERGRLRAAG